MRATARSGIYFGESALIERSSTLLHTLKGNGFAVYHLQFPAGQILEKHVHPLRTFTVTMAGGSREYFGTSVTDLSAGTVRFGPAGLEHRVIVGRNGEELCAVEVTAEFAQRSMWPETLIIERGEGPLRELGRSLLRELIIGDEHTVVAVEGLLLELAATAQRRENTENRVPAWLCQAIEIIRSTNFPLSIAAVAREVGVHPGHLSRTFVRHFNRTPADYQRQVRIDRAMDLLRSTDLTIAAIAHQLGFYDETHMGRVFKQVTGWTPSAFRNVRRT